MLKIKKVGCGDVDALYSAMIQGAKITQDVRCGFTYSNDPGSECDTLGAVFDNFEYELLREIAYLHKEKEHNFECSSDVSDLVVEAWETVENSFCFGAWDDDREMDDLDIILDKEIVYFPTADCLVHWYMNNIDKIMEVLK